MTQHEMQTEIHRLRAVSDKMKRAHRLAVTAEARRLILTEGRNAAKRHTALCKEYGKTFGSVV